jgi:hypothetical protein
MKWFQISLLLARFKLLMLFEAVCSINCKGASYMRMLICPHVGPKGTFTCHIVCCEHALEWWNNVSPLCFNVSFHSAMETWMLAGACMTNLYTHFPDPTFVTALHYCCALGVSEDDRCIVSVCRCGDCLWGHMFCQWTQGLKRYCTWGHRGRVGSCRHSYLVLQLYLQQCLGLFVLDHSWTSDCCNYRCISNRMSQVFCCWKPKQ